MVNQTFAGLCIITFAVALPVAALLRFRQGLALLEDLTIFKGLAIGGALSLFSLPWYLPVAPGSSAVSYKGAVLSIEPAQIHLLTALVSAVLAWVCFKLPAPAQRLTVVLMCVSAVLMCFCFVR